VEEGEITLCYIVPLIIISTSPDRPRSQKTKKAKKKKQTVPRADKNKFPVGCQIFRRIRRIEKHIPICAVERMSQRKTDGLNIPSFNRAVELWSVTEVSERNQRD
jgi:hypothetical protein